MTAPYTYGEPEDLRTYLGAETPSAPDVLLQALGASTSWVERVTGRIFRKVENQTRVILPMVGSSGGLGGRSSLYVQLVDLVADSVSGVTVSLDTTGDQSYATVLVASDLDWLPFADDVGAPSPRYQRLSLSPLSSHRLALGQRVKIAGGDWGYVEADGSAPDGVVRASVLYAARWYKRKESVIQVMTMPSVGYSRQFDFDPDAMLLIRPFIHERRRGV